MNRKPAGAMTRARGYWEKIAPDSAAVQMMKAGGVSWRLRRAKPQYFAWRWRQPASVLERRVLYQKAQELIQKGVLERVPGTPSLISDERAKQVVEQLKEDQCGSVFRGVQVQQFISPSFCQEKPDKPGEYRCLTDLKQSGANAHCRHEPTKQEGMPEVHSNTRPGDLQQKFDLSDAFYQLKQYQ